MFEFIGAVFVWQFWAGAALMFIFYPLVKAGLDKLIRKNK